MKIYSQEVKITKQCLKDIAFSKDHIEKDFIIKFLSNIPLDVLKDIVSFETIDYEDKLLIQESKADTRLRNILLDLQHKKCIKNVCTIRTIRI